GATATQGISLAALNFTSGDRLALQTVGLVNFCQGVDCQFKNVANPTLVAAFTAGGAPSANTIIPTGRPPFTTLPTLFGGLSTDLPRGFVIFPGRGPNVIVPAGATT